MLKTTLRIALVFMAAQMIACAPNFSRDKILVEPSQLPAAEAAPPAAINRFEVVTGSEQAIYGHSADSLKQSFANAIRNSGHFSKVLLKPDSLLQNPDAVFFDVRVQSNFAQRLSWVWHLGLLILPPIWPALPRHGQIDLQVDLTQRQGGVERQRLQFKETEYFDMFWYGSYRIWDLQTTSERMYLRLFDRIGESFQYQIPVESGMRSDATVTDKPVQLAQPLESKTIAVMDLKGEGINESEARTLTSKLRSELVATKRFSVLERERMDEILQEQGFQQTGCTSTDCYVQMGQLVGVDAMVVGSVGLVGSTWLLSARIIDMQSGQILQDVSQEFKGSIDQVLTQGMGMVARRLSR